ncbi:hypothetical protein [Cedecea sp. NFIX57]|uniref:hypothetical protein n=1 Tax=Cedecea sp. NFIX57 TaxID=1566286 RepID=UPI000A0B4557|nr:hypothetical protein [Cedecea sp. NFIX57]SMG61890.1 hypothetical protein SAMN03159353_10717 [Cedecea sp. NFIX57]
MKDVLYADLVNELRSATRPAIVVLDSLYFDMQEIAERLKQDAGITPLFPKLSFSPSEGARQRQLNTLAKMYGKPVIFVDQYPLACHWESGLVGFQLLNEEKKAIIDRIQVENEWIRSAPTKEERTCRQEESMNRAMSGMGNAMSNILEESRAISAELDEKAANIIETENEAAFEVLKEEYSPENIFKRLQHRIWGKK